VVKVFSVEMRAEYFELGQSIFSQGDAADKFYVIVSGTVDMKEAKSTGFSYTVATLRATNSIGSFMLQNEFDGSMPASPVLQGSPTNKSGNSNSSHRSHKSWNRSQSSREHTAQCMSDVCVLSVGRGAYQRLKSIRANQTKQRTGYLQRRLKLPFFADHDRHSLEQLSAKIKAHVRLLVTFVQ
jgi:CRP-like cAMP-binding protein